MSNLQNLKDLLEYANYGWGILASIATSIGIFLGLKKKKSTETGIFKGMKVDQEVNQIIHELNQKTGFAVTSIGAITNHTRPSNFQILYSTDDNTYELWRVKSPMEQNLVIMHLNMLITGFIYFNAEQMEAPDTKAWYEATGIKSSYIFNIGVGKFDLNGETQEASIVMYVNYTKDKIMTPEHLVDCKIAVNKLREQFQKISKQKLIHE